MALRGGEIDLDLHPRDVRAQLDVLVDEPVDFVHRGQHLLRLLVEDVLVISHFRSAKRSGPVGDQYVFDFESQVHEFVGSAFARGGGFLSGYHAFPWSPTWVPVGRDELRVGVLRDGTTALPVRRPARARF